MWWGINKEEEEEEGEEKSGIHATDTPYKCICQCTTGYTELPLRVFCWGNLQQQPVVHLRCRTDDGVYDHAKL